MVPARRVVGNHVQQERDDWGMAMGSRKLSGKCGLLILSTILCTGCAGNFLGIPFRMRWPASKIDEKREKQIQRFASQSTDRQLEVLDDWVEGNRKHRGADSIDWDEVQLPRE